MPTTQTETGERSLAQRRWVSVAIVLVAFITINHLHELLSLADYYEHLFDQYPYYVLLGAIEAAAGWQGEVVVDPNVPPSLRANWSVDLTVDTRRIRDVLGYDEPVGCDEGLRRTVTSIGSR